MTSYWKVYEAFLAKTLEDEWGDWTIEQTEEDMRQLLESAIPYFKFPRVSFDRNEEGFVEDLNPEEIQILSVYMKCEWLNRSIMTWENVKPLYEERDFSQANLLDKLKYTVFPVYVDMDGVFYTSSDMFDLNVFKEKKGGKFQKIFFDGGSMYALNIKTFSINIKKNENNHLQILKKML